jgi:hypothetical protein
MLSGITGQMIFIMWHHKNNERKRNGLQHIQKGNGLKIIKATGRKRIIKFIHRRITRNIK